MIKIAVVGGGASGLMCASLLAENNNFSVSVYERTQRVGKKLLATGNGQGNFTNQNISPDFYHGNFKDFPIDVLNKYGSDCVRKRFENLGVYSAVFDGGRVYPLSLQANSLLDALRFDLSRKNVDILCDCFITEISKKNKRFFLADSQKNVYDADCVVLCVGGSTAKQYGTDGSSYLLAEKFGHKKTAIYPSLVQLKTDTDFIKNLKGIKADCIATAFNNGKKIKSFSGDVLFTDCGISGNAIFYLSAYAVGRENVTVGLEFLPQFTREQIKSMIDKKIKNLPCLKKEELLCGILNKQLGISVLKKAGENLTDDISSTNTEKVSQTIKNFVLSVIGNAGFNYAQVTKGGIDVSGIDKITLSSKKVDGLYFAGEYLDVDGDCGGYNLQWAFASAMAVADGIKEKWKN